VRHLRTKLLSKSKFLGFHPIDIYKCKPFNFENMTFYEYFQKYELNKMIHPSFEKYGKVSLSFIVYKNEKLVIFIDFHLIHNSEGSFYNMLLQKKSFRDENNLLSKHDIHQSYVHECQIQGLLPNLESLQNFLHQYATQNIFIDEKYIII
jgi:hypothetical protein